MTSGATGETAQVTLPETQYTLAPDGVHIAYQVSGSGDIDLLLMHGTVSHLEIAWEDPKLRRLYERLGEFSRLIRFDRRAWACRIRWTACRPSTSRSATSSR